MPLLINNIAVITLSHVNLFDFSFARTPGCMKYCSKNLQKRISLRLCTAVKGNLVVRRPNYLWKEVKRNLISRIFYTWLISHLSRENSPRIAGNRLIRYLCANCYEFGEYYQCDMLCICLKKVSRLLNN